MKQFWIFDFEFSIEDLNSLALLGEGQGEG